MLNEMLTPDALALKVSAGDEQSFFKDLEKELLDRVDEVIRPTVLAFVKELNDRGFEFTGPLTLAPGEMKFQCEAMRQHGLDLKQVLAVDVVITTGRCL